MTKDEIHARAANLLEQESAWSMTWFYLSFADDSGWKGVCIVEARGFVGAVLRCNVLDINPHGEVQGAGIPEEELVKIPIGMRDKLLSRKDLEEIWGAENIGTTAKLEARDDT